MPAFGFGVTGPALAPGNLGDLKEGSLGFLPAGVSVVGSPRVLVPFLELCDSSTCEKLTPPNVYYMHEKQDALIPQDIQGKYSGIPTLKKVLEGLEQYHNEEGICLHAADQVQT